MKNVLKNKIIAQAFELGFSFEDIDHDLTLEELNGLIYDFFNENSHRLERLEDECEVIGNDRTQHVSYGDFWADGELVDWSANWHNSPDTKVFHSDFIMEDKTDGLMKCMHLYYLVGETDYNAPEGYYFCKKSNRHVAYTAEELKNFV